MFEDLIQALESLDPTQETIGLKKLCQESGLKVGMWAERLKSRTIGHIIRKEMAPHGWTYVVAQRGRFLSFTFSRITPHGGVN